MTATGEPLKGDTRGTTMGWVEERAAELWQALGAVPDLGRLLVLLEDRFTIWEAPGDTGLCVHYPDGSADLWIPRGERYFDSLSHELGHALCTTGLARHLQPFAPRLARVWGWREEAIANRFAAALTRYWQDER